MAEIFNNNALEPVNSRNIASLLLRHAELEMPEQRLMLAVILHSISDLMDKTPSNKYWRTMSFEFFTRGTHVFFCDMCGLDPDWVVEVLRDHAGLDCSSGGRQ